MPIEYRKFITREEMRLEPETLFVFGDNLERKGYEGQAAQMRGEPNAVGIPTKRLPSKKPEAYFSDADFDEVLEHLLFADFTLVDHLNKGGTVVWPEDGIGTGFAKLQKKAPKIWKKIEMMRHLYENAFPKSDLNIF
jgi:hypothetical protein